MGNRLYSFLKSSDSLVGVLHFSEEIERETLLKMMFCAYLLGWFRLELCSLKNTTTLSIE